MGARGVRRPYTHLVVIVREPDMEVTVMGFYDFETAEAYAIDAGAQWSETYVTAIVKGPLV
jgi:hypothetical protein